EIDDFRWHCRWINLQSEISNLQFVGMPVVETWDSATGGAPLQDAGCLHVEEQRGGAAPLRVLTLALLGDLLGLFAVLAAHRERQGSQALLRDLFAPLRAVAVGPLLEARAGAVPLVQRFRLH